MESEGLIEAFGNKTHEMQEYVLLNLSAHLAKAGQRGRLDKLLTSFDFIQTKLNLYGTNKVLEDYQYSENHNIKIIRDAIELSAHTLDQHSNQLITQLYGRLAWEKSKIIKKFLDQACKSQIKPWLRPRISSFDQVGRPLIKIIEGNFRWGHAMAITPDNKRVIIASDDWGKFLDYAGWDILPPPPDEKLNSTVDVWDIELGKKLLEFKGHSKTVKAIVTAPDNKRVVSLSRDGILKVWNIDTGDELLTRKKESAIYAIHPDGSRILSQSTKGTLKIWDFDTGKEYQEYKGKGAILALHPDGRRVLSQSGNGTLKVWDINTGKELLSMEGELKQLDAITIMSNGEKAIGFLKPNTFVLWDINAGRLLFNRKWESLSDSAEIILTNSAKIIAHLGETISIRDILLWNEPLLLGRHNDWIRQITATSDCNHLVSLSKDQVLKVWSLENLENGLNELSHLRSVSLEYVRSITITPDGDRVISGTNGMSLIVNDIRTGKAICKYDGGRDIVISALAVCPDNKRVVFGARYDDSPGGAGEAFGIVPYKTLNILDLDKQQIIRMLKGHRGDIYAVAISSDGSRAVSSSLIDVMVWDLNIGMKTLTYEKHGDVVSSVAIAPDAIRVVSGSHDKTLRVWDIDTGEDIFILKGHRNAVRSIAIHPSGKQVISASDDKTLKIWDLEYGEEIGTLVGHEAEVNAVFIAPHGKWAVSTSTDKSLRVWDLASRKMITECILDSVLRSVAVAPDGVTIVTGGDSQQIYIFELEEPMDFSLNITSAKKKPLESLNSFEINQGNLREHVKICQIVKFELPVIYPRDIM